MTTLSRPWLGGVPLNPRTALSDLIAKVFSAPFSKVFSAPLGGAAAVAVPWWLTGGIPAANCIAAYDAKNAANLAASYDNLASAATTYDLTLVGTAPTHSLGVGWTFGGNGCLDTSWLPKSTAAFILKFSNGGTVSALCGVNTSDTARIRFYNAWYGGSLWILGDAGVYVTPNDITSGIVAISGKTGYLDGTSYTSIPYTVINDNTRPFYVGGINVDGVASYCSPGAIITHLACYEAEIASYIVELTAAIAAL